MRGCFGVGFFVCFFLSFLFFRISPFRRPPTAAGSLARCCLTDQKVPRRGGTSRASAAHAEGGVRNASAGRGARELCAQRRPRDAGRRLPASASSTGDAACERHRRHGARRRARRGKGCWLPLLLEKCLPATGQISPGCARGNIPRHTVESIGAGSEESICLSLAMGNIQPFVSLDEVRYSAACHENTGAKWLPRPPPLSGGGRGAPGPRRALGRAGAGRPRREAGSLRQGGRDRGTAAPRSRPGDAGKPRPGALLAGTHIPKYPGSLEHPKGRTQRGGRAGGGAGRCGGLRLHRYASAEGGGGRVC